MTQIKHVTEKEMVRRTGLNALGYTCPKKDLILLKKGLKGKKKREVLEHEVNHLKKGEEGPFLEGIAAGVGALGSIFGGQSQDAASKRQEELLRQQNALAQAQLAPYTEFGAEQVGELRNWLAGPGGAFQKPTMEEVQASPGYASRLGAIESSAAARGGLFSGNALRDIGEFGASEYDRAIARRRAELADRLGVAGMGMGAAGQTAGLASGLGTNLTNLAGQRGQRQAGMFGDIASNITGGIGAYQGRQDWNAFLERMK